MYAFFVLGSIPGTNIQITFQMWLAFTAVFTLFLLMATTMIHFYRIYSFAINRPVRITLPASYLHHRG